MPGRLYRFYLDEWAGAARSAYAAGVSLGLSPGYACVDTVVVCGMGGSGAAGDYLAQLSAHYGGVPIYVVKAASVPGWVGSKSLVYAVSFSGNTRETLECAVKAYRQGAKLVAVTRGGLLGSWAKRHGVPVAFIGEAPAPRAGWPNLFYTMLGSLESLGLLRLPRSEVEESIELLGLREDAETEAGRLVDWLGTVAGGWLSIVAAEPYYPAAVRFRSELAENAKLASDASQVPEAGHNIIVGMAGRRDTALLILDPVEEPWTTILKGFAEAVGPASSYTLRLRGKGMLPKLVWATWIAGLSSTLYAERHGLDPEAIPAIKAFRRLVEEKTSWGQQAIRESEKS
ncbi:SIS domain-containing protein [Hyperthermus butylicus]|uniref:Universally conserved protein n=1 Tax=Hyperthermus butylicus (strain DSM 5456 / JCM 9403 / PLM1-5) TaxID=415426 RepID=A2BMR0_HYPBU|nr:SIS domain-containing protein [Hyperthermus butylicus]ABM81271.1 universally conserved protein [Hyperthermus butylicus DSM 5456]